MAGQMRQGQYEPIVPLREGQAPAWIVSCRMCSFAHDAHGATEAEALQSIQPLHERDHTLVARSVDYAAHPIYRS